MFFNIEGIKSISKNLKNSNKKNRDYKGLARKFVKYNELADDFFQTNQNNEKSDKANYKTNINKYTKLLNESGLDKYIEISEFDKKNISINQLERNINYLKNNLSVVTPENNLFIKKVILCDLKDDIFKEKINLINELEQRGDIKIAKNLVYGAIIDSKKDISDVKKRISENEKYLNNIIMSLIIKTTISNKELNSRLKLINENSDARVACGILFSRRKLKEIERIIQSEISNQMKLELLLGNSTYNVNNDYLIDKTYLDDEVMVFKSRKK